MSTTQKSLSLSKGTLSLKFMQKPNIASSSSSNSKDKTGTGTGKVELDRAEVKDDGRWEVSKEVREAWGIPSRSHSSSGGNGNGSSMEQQVTFESSYLPFIFRSPSPGASSSTQTKGRRKFNARGVEVDANQAVAEERERTASGRSTQDPINHDDENEHANNDSGDSDGEEDGEDASPSSRSKSSKQKSSTRGLSGSTRLRSISGSMSMRNIAGSSSASISAKAQMKKNSTAKTTNVRQSIFDGSGTGVDLRSKPTATTPAAPTSTAFMKPSGVDEPTPTASASANKRDRERELSGGGERKKKKVKKSLS
ncbi:hypothetical protein ONZ45_g17559 [Pleurotus djamor]|nr:hypothetical protein ONZ45_g17559 [Pleurotus djamor]